MNSPNTQLKQYIYILLGLLVCITSVFAAICGSENRILKEKNQRLSTELAEAIDATEVRMPEDESSVSTAAVSADYSIRLGGELTQMEQDYAEMWRSYSPGAADAYLDYAKRYEQAIPSPVDVVFLGDSIIWHFYNWDLFETRTYNRGIGGDTIKGVTARLDNIAQMSPKKLFLLIGINSLGFRLSGEDGVCAQYINLFQQIREKLPDTKVYIESILPFDPEVRPDLPVNKVRKTNNILQELSSLFGYCYIDLYSGFLSQDGSVSKELLQADGLHPSFLGSLRMSELLKEYVDGDRYVISERQEQAEQITVLLERTAELELFSACPVGNGAYVEYFWSYGENSAPEWSHLAIRRGEAIRSIYEACPIAYPETVLLAENDNGAVAFIPAEELESGDELVLLLMGDESAISSQVLFEITS